jgi:transcriptional regulator with XRE-family HTH domain
MMSDARSKGAAERLALKRAFGEKVRAHRKASNLTAMELAHRCQLSESTISKIETGRGSDPPLSLVLILCETFAVSPCTMLAGLHAPRGRRAK